jgi:hypothetical protein
MKKTPFLLAISFLSFLSFSEMNAQFSMTASVGISPQQSPGSDYIFVNRSTPKAEFIFNISQVKASYFAGVGTRYDLFPFFFTAEALYNKRQFVYDVAYTYPGFGRSEETLEYSETMHVINAPISIGVQLGIMEVSSGFLPQFVVGHETDLDNISGYTQKLNPLRLGWHTGIAARLSTLRIGLDWQMDSNSYADHIYINNQNLDLRGKSSRLVGTLSYQF